MSLGGGAFAEMRWLSFVPWWNTAGLSDCIPIVSAALTAQTQFFLIYQVRHPPTPFEPLGSKLLTGRAAQNMPSNSVSEMRECVFYACAIVCSVYTVVGMMGYAFVAGELLPPVGTPWEVTAPLHTPECSLVVSVGDRAEGLGRGGCAQAGQKEALEASLRSVPPNIMSAVESGVLTDGFQLGFALSIIVSYPLVVYPLRDTLWTIWVMDSAADTDA